MPSWCGAYLSTGTTSPLPFTLQIQTDFNFQHITTKVTSSPCL